MANSTETKLNFSQMKAAQLKNLEFELTRETRDEIISSLSNHTKVLSGQNIDSFAQERMRKTNGDLMAKLMNLPKKIGERSSGAFRRLDTRPNEVLELNQETRSRIVDTLWSNHQIALEADSISSDCKSKQIDENNALASELLKLKTKVLRISEIKPLCSLDTSFRLSQQLQSSMKQPSIPPMPQQQPPIKQPVRPPLETAEVCRVLGFTYDSASNEMRPPTNGQLNTGPNMFRIVEAIPQVGLLYIPGTDQDSSSPWHHEVSQELRSHLAQKILATFMAWSYRLGPLPFSPLRHVQRLENRLFFKVAKSRDEYFRLIAEKIDNMQRSMNERQEERKEKWEQLIQEMNQQPFNPSNPVPSTSSGSNTMASNGLATYSGQTIKREQTTDNGQAMNNRSSTLPFVQCDPLLKRIKTEK